MFLDQPESLSLTSYLPASALDISEEERTALIAVIPLLKGLNFGYADSATDLFKPVLGQQGAFNMNSSCVKTECGTIACIGGWVGILMGRKEELSVSNYVISSERATKIFKLYYPYEYSYFDWSAIKPRHAAIAVENFLTTGAPRWKEVMATTV